MLIGSFREKALHGAHYPPHRRPSLSLRKFHTTWVSGPKPYGSPVGGTSCVPPHRVCDRLKLREVCQSERTEEGNALPCADRALHVCTGSLLLCVSNSRTVSPLVMLARCRK